MYRRTSPLLRNARSLKDLLEADWAHAGARGSVGVFAEATFAPHRLEPPRPAMECGSFAALIAMLATNDQLALLPRPFVELPALKALLVRVPLREPSARAAIGLVQPADSALTPAAEALANQLRRAGRLRGRP